MCCYLQVYRRSAANEPTARKMMSLMIMFFAVRNVFILFYVVARLYLHFLSSQTIISADLSEQRILTRSEEHTSELQSLMRISYAVFCLKKKNYNIPNTN